MTDSYNWPDSEKHEVLTETRVAAMMVYSAMKKVLHHKLLATEVCFIHSKYFCHFMIFSFSFLCLECCKNNFKLFEFSAEKEKL